MIAWLAHLTPMQNIVVSLGFGLLAMMFVIVVFTRMLNHMEDQAPTPCPFCKVTHSKKTELKEKI